MAAVEPIKITGLAEFNRNLRKINSDLPKALRLAGNEGAEIVASWARHRVEKDTGRAQRSIKAKSTRTEARVSGGSKSVPWYAWLDFGGKVGIKHSVKRPFIKGGRYIYPGYTNNIPKVTEVLTAALIKVAEDATVDVSGG
jgi:hypothetical protein